MNTNTVNHIVQTGLNILDVRLNMVQVGIKKPENFTTSSVSSLLTLL